MRVRVKTLLTEPASLPSVVLAIEIDFVAAKLKLPKAVPQRPSSPGAVGLPLVRAYSLKTQKESLLGSTEAPL